MLVVEQILRGVLLPAVVAGLVLLVAWRPWIGPDKSKPDPTEHDQPDLAGIWGGAAAFALAYVAVHLAVGGTPGFLPTDDKQWLPYMAVLAGAAGLVEAFFYQKKWLRWLLRTAAALLTYGLVLGFMIEHHWSAGVTAMWLGALTLGTLAIIDALDSVGEAHPGASLPLAMVVLASGAAVTLAMTGSAMLGQIMGGLAAASGASLVLAWWQPRLRVSRGGATVFGVLYGGLLAFGYATTADIPPLAEAFAHNQTLATLLAAAAPLMLWIGQQRPLSRLSGWKAATTRALLVALPLAGALYLAANPPEEPTQENKLEGVDYDALYQ